MTSRARRARAQAFRPGVGGKQAQAAATPQEWAAFVRKYRAEMATPENRHTLALLARMSQDANFSVGCYCEDESHCHRSVLRELLAEAGAQITP
jgi:uncharacterized protein YeaO (DUF488 family)